MAICPCLRSISAQRAELPEETDIRVEFAPGPKPTHNVIGANRMDEHPFCIPLAQFSVIDEFGHESDNSHLSHKR